MLKVWQQGPSGNGFMWIAQCRFEKDAEDIAKAMKAMFPGYKYAVGVDRPDREV